MNNSISDVLFAKCGKAVVSIANEFISLEEGDKIPTVSYLQEINDCSRGTVQNAISTLKEINAIKIEPHGQSGTILTYKNTKLLLQIIGINNIVGCMPLPYSKRYEGLATGLVSTIENSYNIKSSLAFVRGAKNRIEMLLSGRYDYAVVSLLAAKQFIKENKDIVIVKELGAGTYTGDHVIIFHDQKETKIRDGMKVGIDDSSIDQTKLTDIVCKGIKVKKVHLSYSNVLKTIALGNIDCAIWNKDEIYDKYMNINYQSIDKNKDDTIAVIVADKKRKNFINFLNKVIDEEIVISKQKEVMDGSLIPTY
jgi:hypothetical protein